MVFQYSLHVLEAPDNAPKHFELLVTDKDDPGLQIATHLKEHLPKKGSVLVWNKGFEGGRNKEMGRLYPQFSKFFDQVNLRLFDLMDIFSKTLYVHPDFQGSASLKKVLPVVIPKMGMEYKKAEVSDGGEAMTAWHDLIWGPMNDEGKKKIEKSLRVYCELDTLVMVEIFSYLMEIKSV